MKVAHRIAHDRISHGRIAHDRISHDRIAHDGISHARIARDRGRARSCGSHRISHSKLSRGFPTGCRPLPLLFLLFPVGCGTEEGDGGGAWRHERAIVEGVEVVRTLGGSLWGGEARLVDELVIGVLDGEEEYMFGSVQEVASDGEGGIYVFDGQVPALRHYDATGTYTRTLGGAGSGPGEYGDASLGIRVLSDGRILFRDPRNGRFNLYSPDGRPLEHWPLASGLFTSRATSVDTTGHVYARILTGPVEPGVPWPIGLLRLSPTGEILDTIPRPAFDGDPGTSGWSFVPTLHWDLHPHGWVVGGVSDRYALELRKPEGLLRIEKASERLEVHPDERAEREALRRFQIRTQGQFMTEEPPPTPRTKPFFRGVVAGDDGTVWVRLHQEASGRDPTPAEEERAGDPDAPPSLLWSEPLVYDVFEADGSYLGAVRVPSRTTLRTYARDVVWGTRRGELDEIYLVRMRVTPPSAEEDG